MSADKRPICPECGYPAWYVLAPASARFVLDLDGVAQSVANIRQIDQPDPDDLRYEYECGLRHTRRIGEPT